MKSILLSLIIPLSFYTYAQDLGPEWGEFGKYKDVNASDRTVLWNYAATTTEYFNQVAQRQKTALQKLTAEILSKEDLPSGGNYKSIFGEVTLQTGAGFMDNLVESELKGIPVIGAIVDAGIQSYRERETVVESARRINSKNSLVDAINTLADEIDEVYGKGFTIKTMNLIGDDYLPINQTSEGLAYLNTLQRATNKYLTSVPSSDKVYLSTLENLLNLLNKQDGKHGWMLIEVDFRNIPSLEKLLPADLERRPAKVKLMLSDGPYKTRIMNAINGFVDRNDFSVMKLKVNKALICHINASGKPGTTKIGVIRPDYSFVPEYNPGNPNIVIDHYEEDFNPTKYFTGVHLLPLAVLRFNDINGQGVPANTTYGQLLKEIYNNVSGNVSLYKKFTL
jgi:hypothetical protein